jgi:hypothetical protein
VAGPRTKTSSTDHAVVSIIVTLARLPLNLRTDCRSAASPDAAAALS